MHTSKQEGNSSRFKQLCLYLKRGSIKSWQHNMNLSVCATVYIYMHTYTYIYIYIYTYTYTHTHQNRRATHRASSSCVCTSREGASSHGSTMIVVKLLHTSRFSTRGRATSTLHQMKLLRRCVCVRERERERE